MNKILIITSEFIPGPGGIGNHAFNLANHLSKRQYPVDVIAPGSCARRKEENRIDKKFNFGIKRILFDTNHIMSNINFALQVYKQIKRYPNCAVICSGRKPLLFGGLFKRQFKGRQFFLIAHGLDVNPANNILKFIIRNMIKQFDKIIAVSNFTASHIEGINHKKLFVINNGVDINRVLNCVIKEKPIKNEFNNGKISLVTLGRISERKGQKNVIKHLPEIIEKYSDVHYHMIGIADNANALIEELNDIKINKNYTIHGEVSDYEAFTLMNKSDIFIMLSNNTFDGDFEGFGIAILEANLLGLPAIGSMNSGISDAIINGKTGYLVDPENTSDVLDSIEKILNKYNTLSKNAVNHAMQFSWENIIDDYIRVLNLKNLIN